MTECRQVPSGVVPTYHCTNQRGLSKYQFDCYPTLRAQEQDFHYVKTPELTRGKSPLLKNVAFRREMPNSILGLAVYFKRYLQTTAYSILIISYRQRKISYTATSSTQMPAIPETKSLGISCLEVSAISIILHYTKIG